MAHTIDSEKIAQSFSTLDLHDYGDVLQCMRCGTCLPSCPTYKTDAVETQSPRGRIAMIKAVMDGKLRASEEFIEHMYHCLDCRNCQTVCPAGVRAGELVLEARNRIEDCIPQPLLKRFMLEYAIKDQKKLHRFMIPARLYQDLGIQWLVRKSKVLGLLSDDLDFMEALLPPLPARPLSFTIPEVMPAHGQEKGRVGFFLGCAMNLIFADISRDTIEILNRAGYTVIIPKDQQCCGTRNIAEGERKIYREMAEHNVGLFHDKDLDFVVTDCAACGSELKTYGEMLSRLSVADRAGEFSRKVRDVSEFLDSAVSMIPATSGTAKNSYFHNVIYSDVFPTLSTETSPMTVPAAVRQAFTT